jgi:hypothetical protein
MSATEQTRLELLDALSQLSRLRPSWRLGQTVANLAMTAGRSDAGGVWDLEDDGALSAARALIDQYSEIDLEVAELAATPHRTRPAGVAPHDGVAGGDSR